MTDTSEPLGGTDAGDTAGDAALPGSRKNPAPTPPQPPDPPKPESVAHGVRIHVNLARPEIGPGELGLPPGGENPVPRPPGGRRRSGGRVVFGPSSDVLEGRIDLLGPTAKRCALELPVKLPSGTTLRSIELRTGSRLAIDVFASPRKIDSVVASVRSTIGPAASGFSFDRF